MLLGTRMHGMYECQIINDSTTPFKKGKLTELLKVLLLYPNMKD